MTMSNNENLYDIVDGNGNPPYTLYQNEEGKWGLIDKDGTKLPAIYFYREEADTFYEQKNEALGFDPQEGFYLVAWYDPCDCDFME